MKIIREGVFETNSSSTHSITMCMKSDYEKWQDGLLKLIPQEERFLTLEECETYIKECSLISKTVHDWSEDTYTYKGKVLKKEDLLTEEYLSTVTDEDISNWLDDACTDEKPLTFEEYGDCYDDLEYYEDSFTTPSGEEVIAFGNYGYN